MSEQLTIKHADLEDLKTEAAALVITLSAYPGIHPHDAGLGARQVAAAKRIEKLCDKIAEHNDYAFK